MIERKHRGGTKQQHRQGLWAERSCKGAARAWRMTVKELFGLDQKDVLDLGTISHTTTGLKLTPGWLWLLQRGDRREGDTRGKASGWSGSLLRTSPLITVGRITSSMPTAVGPQPQSTMWNVHIEISTPLLATCSQHCSDSFIGRNILKHTQDNQPIDTHNHKHTYTYTNKWLCYVDLPWAKPSLKSQLSSCGAVT